MRRKIIIIAFTIILGNFNYAQTTIVGKVIDFKTKTEIPYVHIGIEGKDYGTISSANGIFKIPLPKEMIGEPVNIYFSSLGYEKNTIPVSKLINESNTIELYQKTIELEEVIISSKRKQVIRKKLGGFKKSIYNTGESNTNNYGVGKEYGIKIKYPGYDYRIENINFYLKYNTIDSVLFRLNIYKVSKNGLPENSILSNQLFVKSFKNDKLIKTDIEERKININQDIIVTVEPVRFWYNATNDNQLFYAQCKGCGNAYLRSSSFSSWTTDVFPPFVIYLNVKQFK